MTKDDIYREIADYLTGTFEVPASKIRPDALLQDDLDLDSIDAVDLMVKLQETTGRKVSADQFETIRTVADLVTLVETLQSA
jgi:acyl carrier protein